MRISFSRDEVYPVYAIESESDGVPTLDVDVATAERWRAAQEGWQRMQDEMDDLARRNPDYYDGRHWRV